MDCLNFGWGWQIAGIFFFVPTSGLGPEIIGIGSVEHISGAKPEVGTLFLCLKNGFRRSVGYLCPHKNIWKVNLATFATANVAKCTTMMY